MQCRVPLENDAEADAFGREAVAYEIEATCSVCTTVHVKCALAGGSDRLRVDCVTSSSTVWL